MKNLLNPKWLFIINTAPAIILLALFYSDYSIINSLLSDESRRLWKLFSISLIVLVAINIIYTISLVKAKRDISVYYGVLVLPCYIAYLYLFSYFSSKLMPFTIPRWMVSDSLVLYAGTFLMPTLIYALFVLVIHFTSANKYYNAWKNFLFAIAIPVSWYLFIQIILPLWKNVGSNFSHHTILILVVSFTALFLFYLIRGVYILATQKSGVLAKHPLLWKIPFVIIFPLLGLALNNGHFTEDITLGAKGVFGDFDHYWFYILAVLNGVLLCLPNLEDKKYRLSVFIGRSITFAYTLYFFLVFLPFLPLSIVAVIAMGVGFLMLTPLLLFFIHLNELSNDFKFMLRGFSFKQTSLIIGFSFLVIPTFVTISYIHDRTTLNETLDYLYSPNYSKKYNIDSVSLKKTIDVIKDHKSKNRDSLFGNYTPYFSPYYNWLVLDNLTLSGSKINNIERVFFANTKIKSDSENIRNSKVKISNISSKSHYDKKKNAWVSSIDIEITNKNDGTRLSEYATTINLPKGCWISDYYLYVGDKKEKGILAEKKAAKFIFSQIRNENRDPGILYYLTGNKVAFRVFPFSKNELRKTGIEFIHKEPVEISIDGHNLKLGNNKSANNISATKINDRIHYVSTKKKSTLKQVYRKPYYHFIVNAAFGMKKYKDDYISKIESLMNKNYIKDNNSKISFVNSYVSTSMLDNNWKEKYAQHQFQGGFYLDRAIKNILLESYEDRSESYPVIVILTDDIKNAIVKNNYSDFEITYPESDLFYNLNAKIELIPHSLRSKSIVPISDKPVTNFIHPVLAYPDSNNIAGYLPVSNVPSYVLLKEIIRVEEYEIELKNWSSGLLMYGNWLSQTFHPEIANSEWLNLVRHSFVSRIMTPVTSYLVVENEAQKVILKRKQEQILASNRSLDLGDNVERMSEPNIMFLILFLVLIAFIRRRYLMK